MERSLIYSPAQPPPSTATASQLLVPAASPRNPPGCRQSRAVPRHSLAAEEGSQKVETLHHAQSPKQLAGARQLHCGWGDRQSFDQAQQYAWECSKEEGKTHTEVIFGNSGTSKSK